jgi:hypothetical protein
MKIDTQSSESLVCFLTFNVPEVTPLAKRYYLCFKVPWNGPQVNLKHKAAVLTLELALIVTKALTSNPRPPL